MASSPAARAGSTGLGDQKDAAPAWPRESGPGSKAGGRGGPFLPPALERTGKKGQAVEKCTDGIAIEGGLLANLEHPL